MTSEPTSVVRARVSTDVAEALGEDARALGKRPGTLLREILEGRYSPASRAGKYNTNAVKTRPSQIVELEALDA